MILAGEVDYAQMSVVAYASVIGRTYTSGCTCCSSLGLEAVVVIGKAVDLLDISLTLLP